MSAKTIDNMINYIEANITEKVTLEDMAQSVGYSAFYCSAKFHEYVGISYKEYIAKRRLSIATKELVNTKMNILDIAIKYGFSSHEAFSRAFNKAYGCTPSKFRKNLPEVNFYEKASIVY